MEFRSLPAQSMPNVPSAEDEGRAQPHAGSLAPGLSGAICLMYDTQLWQGREAMEVFGACVTHANTACERQVCLL